MTLPGQFLRRFMFPDLIIYWPQIERKLQEMLRNFYERCNTANQVIWNSRYRVLQNLIGDSNTTSLYN